MTIRWSEEEIKEYGYRIGQNGDIYPAKRNLPLSHTLPLSESQHSNWRDNEKSTRRKSKAKETHQRSYAIEVISYSLRHRDPDNLCAKWTIDELSRNGIIPDDSSKWIKWIKKSVVKISKPEKEKFEVIVYEI